MPKKILAVFLVWGALLFLAGSAWSKETTTRYFFTNYEVTNDVATKYYPLPGGTTVVRRDTELNYLHADQLSSTRLITDNQGQKSQELNYFPYGQTVNSQSVIRNSLTDKLYTSQILDSSTDLYFYNARQYNPRTAAFISADAAQGPNRYAYVAGNPISRTDPSGNAYTAEVGSAGNYDKSKSLNEKIKEFINYNNPNINPGWEWMAYTQLINPLFYYNKLVEQPVIEKYNISVSTTIGAVAGSVALVYGGAQYLSLAKDYITKPIYQPPTVLRLQDALAGSGEKYRDRPIGWTNLITHALEKGLDTITHPESYRRTYETALTGRNVNAVAGLMRTIFTVPEGKAFDFTGFARAMIEEVGKR